MFVCQSCGQQSVAPTEECTSMVRMQHYQTEILMPCSAWPLTPEEYVRRKAMVSGMGSYFSGTVMLPDGVTIEVSAPIPDETAAEIAVVSVAHALSLERIEKKDEELRKAEEERGLQPQGLGGLVGAGLEGNLSAVAGQRDLMRNQQNVAVRNAPLLPREERIKQSLSYGAKKLKEVGEDYG